MANEKLLINLLRLFVALNSILMAQAEFTDIFNESASDYQLTTPGPSHTNSFVVTCDFDLENIENLLQYLPDICAEIYYNRTENDLYDLYLEESRNFNKFIKKLNDYELRNQANGDKEELTKYPFETKLRNDIYNKIDLVQCFPTANRSTINYLKCLNDKRLEMTEWMSGVVQK